MDSLEKIKKSSISYLSFRIGEETFASHVSHVNNIVEVSRITKIPKAPDYLIGVINLRGQVLPVVDIRVRFGMSPTVVSSNTCILVLEVKTADGITQIGGMVDSVREVLELNDTEIMTPPKVGKDSEHEFISGVASRDDGFILLLDMNQLFQETDLSSLNDQVKSIKEGLSVQ